MLLMHSKNSNTYIISFETTQLTQKDKEANWFETTITRINIQTCIIFETLLQLNDHSTYIIKRSTNSLAPLKEEQREQSMQNGSPLKDFAWKTLD